MNAHGWHNTLPEWILDDNGYGRLRCGPRATLQAVADMCDTPDADGNLMVAFGGQYLAQQAGVAMATLWRHIKKLEHAGYITTLGRGGTIGGRNYGNQYAIPHARGALNHRKQPRELRTMRRGQDNIYRPEIIQPGAQATLWPATPSPTKHWDDDRTAPAAPTANITGKSQIQGFTPVSKRHGGRVKMTRGPCQNETLPSPIPSPIPKRHVASRKKIPHVQEKIFSDTGYMLHYYELCASAGFAQRSEYGLLKFAALVENARANGQYPTKLLAANLLDQRWLVISLANEDAASARLKAYDQQNAPCDSDNAAGRAWQCKTQAREPVGHDNTIDHDAKSVALAIEAARRQNPRLTGDDLDRLALLMLHRTGRTWTKTRYDQANDRRVG